MRTKREPPTVVDEGDDPVSAPPRVSISEQLRQALLNKIECGRCGHRVVTVEMLASVLVDVRNGMGPAWAKTRITPSTVSAFIKGRRTASDLLDVVDEYVSMGPLPTTGPDVPRLPDGQPLDDFDPKAAQEHGL